MFHIRFSIFSIRINIFFEFIIDEIAIDPCWISHLISTSESFQVGKEKKCHTNKQSNKETNEASPLSHLKSSNSKIFPNYV